MNSPNPTCLPPSHPLKYQSFNPSSTIKHSKLATQLKLKMLKLENNIRRDWTRTCDICQAAPCTVYCRADAASLCASCDSDIHTANPLARRHQRVPIMANSDSGSLYGPLGDFLNDDEDDDETASWLNPVKNGGGNENGMIFSGDVDEYLDLNEYNSCDQTQSSEFSEQYSGQQSHYSSVPLKRKDEVQEQFFQLGLEFEGSNGGYNYPPSMCHNVSVSSMDVGVVPESSRNDVSVSHSRPSKGTIDLFSGSIIETPTQLSPIDREARVMRYREKKKTRKFEKTIRYASRKAYAETRPRIKGRFAKRNDAEGEVDQMFSSSLMTETSYGIVPSF